MPVYFRSPPSVSSGTSGFLPRSHRSLSRARFWDTRPGSPLSACSSGLPSFSLPPWTVFSSRSTATRWSVPHSARFNPLIWSSKIPSLSDFGGPFFSDFLHCTIAFPQAIIFWTPFCWYFPVPLYILGSTSLEDLYFILTSPWAPS